MRVEKTGGGVTAYIDPHTDYNMDVRSGPGVITSQVQAVMALPHN